MPDEIGEAFDGVDDEWRGRVALLAGAVWAAGIVSVLVIVLELS